jgi:hypothetical protein
VNKKLKILFFCMIFVSGAVSAQTEPLKKSVLALSFKPRNYSWQSLPVNKRNADSLQPMAYLSPDFYAKQLGFFCRQEIKMDKITKIPFRFRLGSVEQCNWLEGKKR